MQDLEIEVVNLNDLQYDFWRYSSSYKYDIVYNVLSANV